MVFCCLKAPLVYWQICQKSSGFGKFPKIYFGVFFLVDKIRQLCKEQGKTIFSLEQECGFGNGVIHKWDRNSPSVAKVLAVANALGVPVSYLIGEDTEKKPIPEDGDGLSETAKQIMECVSQMSAREQEAFLAWLQASQGRG